MLMLDTKNGGERDFAEIIITLMVSRDSKSKLLLKAPKSIQTQRAHAIKKHDVQSRMFLSVFLLLIATIAGAHSDKTDKHGGHTEKATGIYHCHSPSCSVGLSIGNTLLNQLTKTSYNRDDWGEWSDSDNDCQNTHQELLIAFSLVPVDLSSSGCTVTSGSWYSVYSGNFYTQASDIDIDHVVPLKWAHDHGGAYWTATKKKKFANDPINLIPVDYGLKQAKGARGLDNWLPPKQDYDCDYFSRWKSVLENYPALKLLKEERLFFDQLQGWCE